MTVNLHAITTADVLNGCRATILGSREQDLSYVSCSCMNVGSDDKSTKKPQAGSNTGAVERGEGHIDLTFETRARRSALVAVACACLAQIGDGHVLLDLLSPSVLQELVSFWLRSSESYIE